jgi:D-tyrosyl-tRNA(Tyr) deacylase
MSMRKTLALLTLGTLPLLAACGGGETPKTQSAAPAAEAPKADAAAAAPTTAKRLYEYFCDALQKLEIPVQTGIFQADMQVHLINDGPVTIYLDSVVLKRGQEL